MFLHSFCILNCSESRVQSTVIFPQNICFLDVALSFFSFIFHLFLYFLATSLDKCRLSPAWACSFLGVVVKCYSTITRTLNFFVNNHFTHQLWYIYMIKNKMRSWYLCLLIHTYTHTRARTHACKHAHMHAHAQMRHAEFLVQPVAETTCLCYVENWITNPLNMSVSAFTRLESFMDNLYEQKVSECEF